MCSVPEGAMAAEDAEDAELTRLAEMLGRNEGRWLHNNGVIVYMSTPPPPSPRYSPTYVPTSPSYSPGMGGEEESDEEESDKEQGRAIKRVRGETSTPVCNDVVPAPRVG